MSNDEDSTCRECNSETGLLSEEGLCCMCLRAAALYASLGIVEIGDYLVKVAAFQDWLRDHDRVAA